MKKITFILVAVLIASMSFGQKSLIDKKSKTNSLSSKKQFEQSTTSKTSAKSAKAVGTTIFSSDFSDPSQWTIDNYVGNSDNWVIGTTGPSNSSYMLPIQSTTAANGFALFDSDFLCSGIQNAVLWTTTSFDCSAYANVHIKFETFYRRYNEDGIFVQVSNNGATWTEFEVFAEYNMHSESQNPEIVDIDISSAAGNEETVWVRFKFTSLSSGCDFSWMIDDVLVYEYECELVSIPYMENFTGLTAGSLPDCWAQNNANWSVAETSNANGISPELRLYWSPATTGPNVVYLPEMDATGKSNLTMSFLNSVDWDGNPVDIKLGYTIDDGDTWEIAWEKIDITEDIDAQIEFVDLSFLDGEIFQLYFAFYGNTYDINHWSIDNISIYETQTIPYTEDFTGVPNNTLPDGWNSFNTYPYVRSYSFAGGTSPELVFFCEPGVPGENITYLPTIDATTNSNLTLTFKHLATFNTNPFDLRLDYTIDNGNTWHTAWEKNNNTSNVGPETVIVDLSSVDGEIFQLAFILQGDNDDISWSIDDISISEPLTMPFMEDFTGELTNVLPEGWAQSHANSNVSSTSNASGTSPELMVNNEPGMSGEIKVYLPKMDAHINSDLRMMFSHSILMNSSPFDLRLDYTIDNGATWHIAWLKSNNIANIDPEAVFIDLSSYVGGEIFQLAFVLNAATTDDVQWYIDNISIYEPFTIPFAEDFTGVTLYTLPDCWNKFNTNSYVTGSSNPELMVTSEPGIDGENIVYLPSIDATTNSNLTMTFLHQVDYNTYDFDLRVDYTIDNGETWNTVWEKANNTTDVDPEEILVDLSAVDGEVFQLAFILNGHNDDLAWFIDNIRISEPFTLPFTEDFTGVSYWSLPDYWSRSNIECGANPDVNAGGTIPELSVFCNTAFGSESQVYSPMIDATTNSNVSMTFLHKIYAMAYPCDIKVIYTIDNGLTWSTAWEKTNITTDVDAEEVLVDLSAVDGEVFQLAFTVIGGNDEYSWFIDNISIYEEIICDPLSIPFMEDFTGITAGNLPNCWDKSHSNWHVSETSDAGGSSPELMLDWDPEVTGDIKVYLPTIDATSNSNLAMSFVHFVDYYDNSFDLRLDYTIDDGTTWNTAWEITNVNSEITSEEMHIDLGSFVDGEVFKLAFVFAGNTHDINYWYIDNISIYEMNTINEIDVDFDVNDVYVCVGDNEATALAALAPQMKINDTNGVEYVVDLTWTIAAYNGSISGDYVATGTFTLPSGVEQTTIPTPLEVTAIVTVNDPLVITFDFETEYCLGSTPGALPTTSVNNITGTWSPATIITTTLGETDYTFTPDAGECTDLPFLIISVTVVDIPSVTCPSDFTITENGIVALSGGLPTGGIYSGTGVTGNNFDPSSLTNDDYIITYTFPGTGCSNSCDFTITVNIINSVSLNETAEISIYPNPNNGMFNLSFGNVNGKVNYQIYNIKGSVILNKDIQTNGETIEEVSLNLTSGVYFVRIITATQTIVEKLVIE
ncbi:MAG: T9SS type A sorting domain-containing protein [Bacteroidales bacterium]|nr:T9SS type A sorting domain-containing protein [Bacteroidales bacterium]